MTEPRIPYHEYVPGAGPRPRATPWKFIKLRTRSVIRSADGGLVCVLESGYDREQVEQMVAAVNSLPRPRNER